MRILLTIVFCSLVPALSIAQGKYKLYEEEKPVLMRNEISGGATAHSQGWGLDLRRGYQVTVNRKRLFEVELVGMKHPKEIRTVNPYFENARSYIYGKSNTLTVLRMNYGFRNTLYDKAEKSGIEVSLHYAAGAVVGFTKPIYLEILHPTSQPFEFSTTTEKYDPFKHFTDNIYGRSPFTVGLDELALHPGLTAKLGVGFEYGGEYEVIKALEAGIAVDAYTDKVPVMALIENDQLYFTFYINLLFGKKW